MRWIIRPLLSIILLSSLSLNGQSISGWLSGTVTFVSSSNIYVKFTSTNALEVGDTLWIELNQQLFAYAVITNKSSTSTVCLPLSEVKPQVSDVLFAKLPPETDPDIRKEPPKKCMQLRM
jgi:hypothetical protein